MADCKKIVVKKDGSLDGLLKSIAFIEASALRWKALPVMSIWEVSLMLLPPPCNDDDRYFLAECIVSAIERWGMRIYSYPLSLTHPAMFEALVLGEKLEAKIHIDEFERFAVEGKITKGCVVIALIWREYIKNHEDRLICLEGWRDRVKGIEVYEKDINDYKNNSLFSALSLTINENNKQFSDLIVEGGCEVVKACIGRSQNYELINLGRKKYKDKYDYYPSSGAELWREVIELLPEKRIVMDKDKKGQLMICWGGNYCIRSNFLRLYRRHFK